MKILFAIFIVPFTLALIGVLSHGYLFYDITKPGFFTYNKVEVGQVWIYTPYNSNPFKRKEKYRDSVIAVDEGYVLFVRNNEDTLSYSISTFKFKSELETK